MSDHRAALLGQLAANEHHIASLELDHARMVSASESSNADDEHDPEGATIAFERQMVVALLERARAARAELLHAVGQLEDGTHGTCEGCGLPIPAERLQVRPQATRCVGCAS